MHELERACATHGKSDNRFVALSLDRYVKLTYMDRLNTTHTEYFFVPPIYGASRISADAGEQMFALHRSLFSSERFIDFDRVSADILIERIRTLTSRQPQGGGYSPPAARSAQPTP
jgi:hypothetical protein